MDSKDPQTPTSTYQAAKKKHFYTDESTISANGNTTARSRYRWQQVEQLRLLYELRLYTLQRVVCLGLAIWFFLQTGDIVKFLIILAAGFMNIQWAMKILVGFVKAVTSED